MKLCQQRDFEGRLCTLDEGHMGGHYNEYGMWGAFQPDVAGEVYRSPAMLVSKREWFAGMALQGILGGQTPKGYYSSLTDVAIAAFALADAMIAESEKGAKP